nr:anthocyanidin 3-O-glucosyltransferase 2-like [Ipomoea trifida]
MIPFLELTKLIVQKGHKASSVSTPRNINRLPKLPPTLVPLINFVKLPLPPTPNLPENAEATIDLPYGDVKYLKKAHDGLREAMSKFLQESHPDCILFGFDAYCWRLGPSDFKYEKRTAAEEFTVRPKCMGAVQNAALGMGHLLSAVEIAELLIHRDHHISITIFILTPPFDLKITSFIQSQTPERRLKFVTLPLDESISIDPTNIPAPSMIPIDSFKPRVRECVKETIRSVRLGGFVIDMFSTAMIDVADEFGVPAYVFYTSDAAVLGFLLHMQKITLEGFRA